MGDKLKIGWIGLGKMGIPMSTNLVKAGYPLKVYNRTKEKTKELADQGAEVADSPKAAAEGQDVVVSMISDDSALEAVSIGPGGAFEGAKSGTIFVDMSTVSPGASARVAAEAEKKGIKYLRAPVSGSTALATAGTLTIFASGPKDAYEQCVEIFGKMGQKSFHVGTGEEARYLKLVLNMMVGLTSAMVAEALTFGEAGGMDWEQMIDIVNNSVVASPLVGYKAQILKDRNFAPAFSATQMAKDFDIALDTGRINKVPMPMTSIIRQFYGTMMATGKGDMDFFGLLSLMEELAGMKK
ncbi:MAG: NAD(P)-dependent oxidoreductase [Deltaproteobacteria bacterium]|nr:MAG: NAD(P)-dependent oxidoreductase [Deltaproteobacteria bacterium]